MKITVVGTGYVGLVSGVCFADIGVDVTCVDIDEEKINQLKEGIIPIYEPGLEEMVERNAKSGRLKFTTNLEKAMEGSQVLFIAVGTPTGENGQADLKYVFQVAEEVGLYLKDYMVVVTKSTVPVGTTYKVKEIIENQLKKRGVDIPFSIASNPEFLKEGAAIDDFKSPDRVVIGIEDEKAKEIMFRLYKPFQLSGERNIFMDIASSEMTKYAANAMLATKISFMNEIANLCELVGADVDWVRKGIGTDPRIGKKFIYPGVGYGGSCFPKDVNAIIQTAKGLGYELKVLQAVEAVNVSQKKRMVEKIVQHFGEDLSGLTIGIWGLSFKPNTDDMRDAPSVMIIQELLEKGAKIKAYDPVAMEQSKKHYFKNEIHYAHDIYDAANETDAVVLITEWAEFRIPAWDVLKKIMKQPVIFDGRNLYDRKFITNLGFQHYGIGT